MQNEKMRKFLDGNVNDIEFAQCETLLEALEPDALETVVDENAIRNRDSLIVSLSSKSQMDLSESDDSKRLTNRIESLVPRQVIGKEDLDRILDSANSPEELGRIGKYRVMEFIAAGGMGLVFKAEDTELSRLVCIKVMHPALAMKNDARLRFERESRAAAKLRSERIVTLFDIGIQRDLPYIVMQLLEGESLRTKLSRVGKIASEQSIHYLTQIAEGLRHAHAFGIVHRDIKPDNIWITPEDDVKLLDFGLARALDESTNLTTSGGLLGTPNYMSPEQVQGKLVDARSDLFSVGIVLYEMLTGQLPFHKNNLFSTMISIANDSVKLPIESDDFQMPVNLRSVLCDLLHKDPEERLPSVDELIARLQCSAVETNHEITTIRAIAPETVASRGNSGIYKVVAGILLGAAAALLGIFLIDQNDKGTLIVRTNDPSVEIQIAKERVSVKDPLSGRKYEIQIGETPLHGGVYQLEMTNETGDFRFSSSTIAIRRGEKTIVDVELKPNKALETNSHNSGVADQAEKLTQPIADGSFDPNAKEKFSEGLPKLPSLALDDLLQSTYLTALPSEQQTKKKTLPGVDHWSITPLVSSSRIENCDRTLVARLSGHNICIFNRSDEIQHVLPATGPISDIQFDSKYPNLIAHCVTSVEDGNSSWIYIWRLDPDKANLIYRIPASGYGFAWESGYRIAYHRNDQLAFFRLDLGKSFDVPGPGKEHLISLSPNGKFITTQSSDIGQTAINIWDLHRGVFSFSVLHGEEAIWSADEHRIAIRVHRSNDHEIWDLDNSSKLQTIAIQPDTEQRFLGGDRIVDTAFEKTFKRLAWLTTNGEVVIRNIETNRQNTLRMPATNPNELQEMRKSSMNSGSLAWDFDGTLQVKSLRDYKWSQTESEVHGILTPIDQSNTATAVPKMRLQFSGVYGANSDITTLEWNDQKTKANNFGVPSGNMRTLQSRPADTWLQRFDLNHNTSVRAPVQSFISLGTRVGVPQSAGDHCGLLSVSPNGAYCIDARLPTVATDANEWFITSLSDPSQTLSLGFTQSSGPKKIIWQASGKYFMTLDQWPNQRELNTDFRLFDTETFQWKPLPYTKLPIADMLQIIPYEEHFILVTKFQSSSHLQLWKFDPQTLRAEELKSANSNIIGLMLSGVKGGSISAIGKSLFFTPSAESSVPLSINAIPLKSYLRIPDEGEDKPLLGITAPTPNRLLFSPDGQFVLQDAPIVNGVSATVQGISYSVQNGAKFITRWSDDAKIFEPTSKLEPSKFEKKLSGMAASAADNLKWHRDSNVAFWNYFGIIYFYDADSDRVLVQSIAPANLTNPSSVLATDYGWLVCGDSQLFFFNRTGDFLGQLVFDPELSDDMPANPRWILADGSTCSGVSQRGLYISLLKGTDFHSMPLEAFAKSFPDVSLPTFDKVPFLKD